MMTLVAEIEDSETLYDIGLSSPAPQITRLPQRQRRAKPLPPEAEFILSALEAARYTEPDRRSKDRLVARQVANLRLFSDRPDDEPWAIYTRDATTRSIGFISRRRLPLGYGGKLHLHGPNGEELSVACTIRRCREAVNNWYEGSLSFNREQWAYDLNNTNDAD